MPSHSYNKSNYLRRIANGLCGPCGQPADNESKCTRCKVSVKKAGEAALALGKCPHHRSIDVIPGTKHCNKCLLKSRKSGQAWYARARNKEHCMHCKNPPRAGFLHCESCTRVYSNSLKLRKYGISLLEYEDMVKQQQGVCAICKHPETIVDKRTKKPRNLAIDHDHQTGVVRGLLCAACNTGNKSDDLSWLRLKIEYLQTHQGE